MVPQDFQGQPVFLGDLILLLENQGIQDHLACLEHLGFREPQAQMVRYSSSTFNSIYTAFESCRFI
jgi:hypothetical protein